MGIHDLGKQQYKSHEIDSNIIRIVCQWLIEYILQVPRKKLWYFPIWMPNMWYDFVQMVLDACKCTDGILCSMCALWWLKLLFSGLILSVYFSCEQQIAWSV